MKYKLHWATAALLSFASMNAANYSTEKTSVDGIEVVRLRDAAHDIEVSIVPSIGNIAYEMKVKGQPVLYLPAPSLGEFKQKPGLGGVPFLGPWANRLDHDGFYANGKSYILNPGLGNIRRDQNGLPIHGLVSFEAWTLVDARTDANSAQTVSRLDFWRRPDWMAQFPFAHTLEMTYRLSNGVLEVRATVENHSSEPMPLIIGFHPYYQLTDAPRDQWKVHLAVHDHYTLSPKLIPTGETTPVSEQDVSLAGRQLDDVFGGVNSADEFRVEGKNQRLSIRYGPKYTTAVVYAPPGKQFICFEPMTGITDGMNLAHEGHFQGLQSVPAGGKWEESFWIKPEGF